MCTVLVEPLEDEYQDILPEETALSTPAVQGIDSRFCRGAAVHVCHAPSGI